ncbi:putative reverse transcriptase domain-containing protein [Tanacetum coccineum]
MMCTKMVPEEEDRVEKFIGGLLDNIQGNVIAAEPTRLQDAVRIANNLMDQKLKCYAVRNAENKRRLDNNYGNNRGQQPSHKRQNTGGQNVAKAYVAANNEVKKYEGTLPFCNKCKLHHVGPCTVRCVKCNKVGHLARNCRVTNPTTPTQGDQIVNQKVVELLIEVSRQGLLRSDCPRSRTQNMEHSKQRVPDASGRGIYTRRWWTWNRVPNTVHGTHAVIVCDKEDSTYSLWKMNSDRSRRQGVRRRNQSWSNYIIDEDPEANRVGCQLFLAQVTVKESQTSRKYVDHHLDKFVIRVIDDILILISGNEVHDVHLRLILGVAQEGRDIRMFQSVTFGYRWYILGHVIDRKRRSVDTTKIGVNQIGNH